MRVLVCGGAGYIGSNMTAWLAQEGHEPTVYDNFSKGHRAAVSNIPVVTGDLADTALLVETLKANRIEAVMHFAAWIEVGESVMLTSPRFITHTRAPGGAGWMEELSTISVAMGSTNR